MKRIALALVLVMSMITGAVSAKAPDNFVYYSKTLKAGGKSYVVKYCIADATKGSVELTLGLAGQRLFVRDDPAKIASYENAIVALTGPYHKETTGSSQYLFDSHYIVNGKAAHIYNGGSNICITNDGRWLWGRLRFNLQGKVKEKLLPASLGDVYLSGVNQAPTYSSTTVYTSEYGSRTPSDYAQTCVVLVNGIVTDVRVGVTAIPKNGMVLMYTGANRSRCDKTRWPKGYIRKGLHINIFWVPQKYNNVDLNTWKNSKIIFGGSPTVVKNGKAYWNLAEDTSYNISAIERTTSRQAFGIDGKGKAFFVSFPQGMSVQEEGPLLVQLGVKEAFNLDGACSQFFYFDGKVEVKNCRPLPAIIIGRVKPIPNNP
jgi:hypothetical protein